MATLNPSKKCENKKKFFKRSYVLRILRRFRKKTPILLNRMSKNGLGRFLGEPTLNVINYRFCAIFNLKFGYHSIGLDKISSKIMFLL